MARRAGPGKARMTARGARLLAVALCALGSTLAAQVPAEVPLVACLESIAATLPAPAAAALGRIDGSQRQLLAVVAYLRVGNGLAARWSWDEQQIAEFRSSSEWQTLQAALQQLRSTFERLNPGFTLHVNDEVRSLDRQIERWNDNASVAAAATALWRDAVAYLSDSGTQDMDAATVARCSTWLQARKPEPTPTLAAPGLSLHGQARAFDFEVRKGDRVVAGTDSDRIAEDWDSAGWTQQLAIAVAKSDTPFRGPLASPREPWHYAFEP